MGFTGRRNPPISYYGSIGRGANGRSRPHQTSSLDPGHEDTSRDTAVVVAVRSHDGVDGRGGLSCSSRPRGGGGEGGGGHAKGWRVASLQLLSALALGAFVAVVRFAVSDSSPTRILSPRGGGERARMDNTAVYYPNLGQDHDETMNSNAIGSSSSGGGLDDRRINIKAIGGLASLIRPGEDAAGASTLSFTAANFYHLRDGKPAQDYPWLEGVKLIEPHRETTLAVTDPREGFEYRWEFRLGGGGGGSVGQATGEAYATAVGADCTVILTQLDDNVVLLEEVDGDGEVSRRLEERVMVKYVRREIRTLTDQERGELLDAMATMWEVRSNGDRGRELFGEEYTDVWGIGSLHFTAAGQAECDHFHDGLGFLTSHSQLSNTFEHSLQLVNPKLTLPYWDFTIEASERSASFDVDRDDDDDFGPQRQSPLLRESWFGGSDPEDDQVKDGRWRYTEVPDVATGLEGDIFQRLRAPWNVDKRPYLTRGLGNMCGIKTETAFPWPTCKVHYELLARHSDFYGWVWDAQYDPHGPVHIWLGGVLDCEASYARVIDLVGKETGTDLAMLSFIHRKNLYREGVFKCAKGLGDEEEEAFPSCGCLDYDLESGGDYLEVMDSLVLVETMLRPFDESTSREVVSIICSAPMAEGDQLQASSPLDPTFWPIHPTMERLLMFKRLTGTMTDLSWPDKDTVEITPTGTERLKPLSLYSDQCIGHRGSEVFPFGLLDKSINDITIRNGISLQHISGGLAMEGGGGGGGDGSGSESGGGSGSGSKSDSKSGGSDGDDHGNNLSNREVLLALDPRVNSLPYVYDTFRWDHCAGEGFNFGDILTWSPDDIDQVADADVDYSSAYLPLGVRNRQTGGTGRESPPSSKQRLRSGSSLQR